jgi:hypothetical protein
MYRGSFAANKGRKAKQFASSFTGLCMRMYKMVAGAAVAVQHVQEVLCRK